MTAFKLLRFAPLLLMAFELPVVAQSPADYGSVDPAAQLSANLMILSQNPRDVNALLGAGQSAIAVGDGNAALSFLARAEEISPRDGRIKAALGSALVMMEKPGEALKLFADAIALGVPEARLAADRGLAYDLRGDSRRAQREYQLAQRQAPSDEVTRRLALSLGISGDQKEALTLIDPLLRKQDQGAWRARAFILAMTGDVSGAEGVARSVMPIGSSDTMTPFLRRLAGLNAAERALAVNFGTMPSDGTRLASVETGDPFRASGSGVGGGLIPAGEPLRRAEDAAPVRKAEPVSKEPRRRPGRKFASAGRPDVRDDREGPELSRRDRDKETQIAIATPPPVSGRISRRLETRIGPVPQSVRDSSPKPGFSVTPLEMKSLPPPTREDIARARSAPVAVTTAAFEPDRSPQAAPLYVPQPLTSAPPSSTPVFEVPSPVTSVTPRVAVAGSAPPASTPVTSAPSPTAIAAVALPPSTVADNAFGSFSLSPAQASAAVGDGAASLASTSASPPSPSASPPAPSASPPATLRALPDPPISSSASLSAPGLSGIAQIIATIEPEAESASAPLPTAAEIRAARIAAQRKADAQTKADAAAKIEKDKKDAERLASKKHPARIWVQVATGSNEAGLPSTWKKLRDKAPTTFKGLGAASVPFRATNRLLVGPFRSQAEARALLNSMQKAGMSGSTYASEAGQEVAKIATR